MSTGQRRHTGNREPHSPGQDARTAVIYLAGKAVVFILVPLLAAAAYIWWML